MSLVNSDPSAQKIVRSAWETSQAIKSFGRFYKVRKYEGLTSLNFLSLLNFGEHHKLRHKFFVSNL